MNRSLLAKLLGMSLVGTLAASAAAQDTIHAVAGRGIGDGRAATAAALFEPVGVGIAADGAILIADSRHERVRRVDPTSGTITTYAGTVEGGLGDGEAPEFIELKLPVRTLVQRSGDVLIVEQGGKRIRRVRHDTGFVDALPVGTGVPAIPLAGPNDVDEDAAGNVYVADFAGHRVLMVTPVGVTTVFAGTGAPGFGGDNGAAVTAQLNFPACVLVGPGNVVYICDKANNRIRRVAAGIITTIAGTGVAGFTGDGPATAVEINQPEDAILDGNTLVFTDQENNRIRQIDLGSGQLTTIAGTGPNAFAGDNVPAASTLASPMGLVKAPDGRLLFVERDAQRVRALANGTITTVAGDGISTFGGDNGPALDATFYLVEGVAQDAAGNLFISDSGNNRIRKVDGATGTVTTIAGNGTTTFGVDGVPATVVGLDSPSDIVVDAAGNVIFADTNHQRVRSVDASGTIRTIVGTGVAGFTGDNGPANAAQVSSPTGLELDAAGNLYVADFGNNRIRRVDTAGNITTVAGTGTGDFNGDGLAATATDFFNPTDVAFDSAGNMVVADMRNHRVRRIDATTAAVTTLAGTGQPLGSDDFIPAVTATLKFPTDVAIDPNGNVLIADSGTNRIRRVSAQGVIDTLAGTRDPGDLGDDGPPAQARLLTPLRIQELPSGGLLIVDHDNHRIRGIGATGGGGGGGGGGGDKDCTQGTCIQGGGSKKTDCFLEFRAAGARGNKVVCKDGDASCDTDSTPGQCTIAIQSCFGVADPRLKKCTPSGVSVVQLVKPRASGGSGAESSAAHAILTGLSSYAKSSTGGGSVPLVAFDKPVTGCGAAMDVVVPIAKRKGKLVLRTVASIAGSGRGHKDPDTVTVFCVR
jgi:sugar lactone lactonase YvrE